MAERRTYRRLAPSRDHSDLYQASDRPSDDSASGKAYPGLFDGTILQDDPNDQSANTSIHPSWADVQPETRVDTGFAGSAGQRFKSALNTSLNSSSYYEHGSVGSVIGAAMDHSPSGLQYRAIPFNQQAYIGGAAPHDLLASDGGLQPDHSIITYGSQNPAYPGWGVPQSSHMRAVDLNVPYLGYNVRQEPSYMRALDDERIALQRNSETEIPTTPKAQAHMFGLDYSQVADLMTYHDVWASRGLARTKKHLLQEDKDAIRLPPAGRDKHSQSHYTTTKADKRLEAYLSILQGIFQGSLDRYPEHIHYRHLSEYQEVANKMCKKSREELDRNSIVRSIIEQSLQPDICKVLSGPLDNSQNRTSGATRYINESSCYYRLTDDTDHRASNSSPALRPYGDLRSLLQRVAPRRQIYFQSYNEQMIFCTQMSKVQQNHDWTILSVFVLSSGKRFKPLKVLWRV
ncbi:uncharacterized protein I303_102354 [Kwoniella dejecticola CBS 10117]|uniref:Uncharacterized protein n=1 Tax=Kwoniella dejecticola CBS 10117 TaxID=1296121 RepID=A0AAJ8KLR9_9TREE